MKAAICNHKLLSMLANYYDVARQDQFEAMFGRLKVGAAPSALKNRCFIFTLGFFLCRSHGHGWAGPTCPA